MSPHCLNPPDHADMVKIDVQDFSVQGSRDKGFVYCHKPQTCFRNAEVMDGLRDALCHPSDLVRYRALQSVHMFDPDFRLARSRHPFIVIYDNHDVNWKDANSSLRAFREWVPMRGRDEDHALEGGFRHFRFGEDVVDVYMLDTAMASTGSLLGQEQEEWLKTQLLGSDIDKNTVFFGLGCCVTHFPTHLI